MRPRRQSAWFSAALVAALAAVLVVLAVLQYRWSDQISEAERRRVESALNVSVNLFRLEFNRELIDLNAAFHEGPPPREWAGYLQRYLRWRQRARFPEMVSAVYVAERPEDSGGEFLALDAERNEVRPASPGPFEALLREPWDDPHARRFRGRELRSAAWRTVGGRPVLVHNVSLLGSSSGRRWGGPRTPGLLLIALDARYLRETVLPALAERYFGGPEGFTFQVAVLDGGAAVYLSDAGLEASDFEVSDARLPLLWDGRGFVERSAGRPRPAGGPPPHGPGQGPPNFPEIRARVFPLIVTAGPGQVWELAVRHPDGSLAAMVAGVRRRNLAVSFGILLLLATGMAIVFVNSQRAQRLARLQMDFVAGVSHELRTPLAVIRSAADNLAEGVVGSMQQAREYGRLMRSESRRLATMIEQTLQFSAVESGRKQYDLQPLAPEAVIEAALREAGPVIADAGFEVERDIPPALPPVMADRGALLQCLQNLMTNAVKYGGESRWLAVSAARSGGQVRFRVEDRGIGIPDDELGPIFDPFYRGRAVVAAQIQGSGLGLSLARDMIQAMGGKLTVESAPGRGSAFTIHLPAAPLVENEAGPLDHATAASARR